MAEITGLPKPAPEGATALVPGTYDGQTVFVTGGGTGLGKAIATEFARLGANLVIASRKPEHLEAGQAAIEEIGAEVLVVGCDIRQADQIAEAFDAATERFAMPDVLINNAAANFPVPAEDMSPNAWRTVVDITLNGTFFCAREFTRRHLAAGTPGSIVNIGASYAWTGGPGFAHSAAAKAGVMALTRCAAIEAAETGVRVNCVAPSLAMHPFLAKTSSQEFLDSLISLEAFDRAAEPWEVANVMVFLASDYSTYMTGEIVSVSSQHP